MRPDTYFEKGDFLYVNSEYKSNNEDIAVVIITNKGFRPNTPEQDVLCPKGLLQIGNKKFQECKNYFYSFDIGSAPVSALASVFTAAATLTAVYPKKFDHDLFFETIEDANLNDTRLKLLKIKEYAKSKEDELRVLYESRVQNYKDYVNKISFNYIVKDDSKFGFKTNVIDNKINPIVLLNKVKVNKYNYYSIEDTKNLNFEIEKEKIDKLYYKDLQELNEYFSNVLNFYKVEIKQSNTLKLNNNIELNLEIKKVNNIKYIENKEQIIDVYVNVKSINILNAFKEVNLGNNNLMLEVKQENDKILTYLSNKTPTYYQVDTISLYYNGDISTKKNLNVELAPKSRTLKNDSQYNLITTNISKKSNFYNVTKEQSKTINISYGFAIKYNEVNTNIDNTLYKEFKYTLFDFAKEYL